MTMEFVHLKCHTEYSLSDGLLRVADVVDMAADDGMMAVAVTDLVNLFALVKFYKKAIAKRVKPIIGAELFVRDGDTCCRVTVLCQNQQGYLHLTQLISEAYLTGQHQSEVPEVTWESLAAHAAGLLVLSGGRHGDVGEALIQGDQERAKTLALRWQSTFGDRFYLELVRTQRPGERDYLHAAVALAEALSIPVVATHDVRFKQQSDYEAHEARVCIHAGYQVDDPKRPRNYSEQQYFTTTAQMVALFEDIPEAIENTVAIAKRCNVKLTLGKPCLPNFPLPPGVALDEHLKNESLKGLEGWWPQIEKQSHGTPKEDYLERLKIELDVINRMGFPGYFLIVADFIRWAKDNDIPVGPGRGSGAGSLVAYCLGITTLDPLEHGLLFERFLNPERVSMPDFDVDFCMDRRDDVIDYVARHYGQEAVSQIITYGTMAAKAVVRDVGRVLGHPYGFVDKLAKLIPFELGMTLDKALEQEEQLQARYRGEEEVKALFDLARKLEGVARNAGKHAGGVVIAPSKLTDFTPIYCEPSGEHPVTQFDKDDVEAVGLVKFDFLGLRTLTIIHWALTAINARLAKQGEPAVDIDTIPLDDEKSFALLKECTTTAVFQLESRGMKELIRRLQPDSFEEITALVALFRPGPLQSGMVDDFIDRKHGRAEVEYPHPELEPILNTTYGVILYQEQVMQIAQVLANYTLGGADILRRAMGKKKPEEMAKQREVFSSGAVARGIAREIAEPIFDLIEKFAGYGFNKSHSAAYALIAYQTAYLKAHYPAEFMAAVLSSDMDNTDKVVGFLEECRSMGLRVNRPNINVGEYYFRVNEAGQIEYGLGAIKGVGQAACEDIVAVRAADGEFASLFDFCQRVDMRKLSRRGLEPLIRSGSMDPFSAPRAHLMASIDKAIKAAEQEQRNRDQGQNDMFAALDATSDTAVQLAYVEVKPWGLMEKLSGEKETLGYYISGHPFDIYRDEMKSQQVMPLHALAGQIGKKLKIAGLLVGYRPITTKSGRRMAVLTLEDHTGRTEVTLFSRPYKQAQDKLETGAVLAVTGKVEKDDYTGGARMLGETVQTLAEIRSARVKRLVLRLHHDRDIDACLTQLPLIMQPFSSGSVPVIIGYYGEKAKGALRLAQQWSVRPEAELIDQLRQCCGDDAVLLEY